MITAAGVAEIAGLLAAPAGTLNHDAPTPCGGCGETTPAHRCIGCLHDFGTPDSAWVHEHRATPSPSTDTLEQTVADIGDDELIRRVIAGLVRRPRTTRARTEPLWSRVGKRFALGSTYSMQLCRRFNFNPDERVLP
ncbi:hypothetical protein [Sphingomonas sp.]|uniref:hypothetical protein n=1 Tax=Sphingomonas sp. TaxID=28214 RepID=UPI00307E1A2F